MPTTLRTGPYRFFFYSNDGAEAPHIHVERERLIAKFWLTPVRLASAGRFSSAEVRQIKRIVEEELEWLRKAWDEFFER